MNFYPVWTILNATPCTANGIYLSKIPTNGSLMIQSIHPILSILRCILTYTTIVIMCHLQTSSLVPALDVESFVGFTAVENALVTTNFLCNEIKSLNQFQAKFLALLIFRDGDIFDMSNESEMMDTAGCQFCP